MLTDYEKELMDLLEKEFSSGEFHYDFDLPEDPDAANQLLSTLKSLEAKGCVLILVSPEDGYDYIEVEKFPPCCKPPVYFD